MLIQEEPILKKQEIHSISLMGQQGVENKLEKKNGKGKEGASKIKVQFVDILDLSIRSNTNFFFKLIF